MALNKRKAAEIAELVQFAYNMFDNHPNKLRPDPDPGIAARGYVLTHWLNATDQLFPHFEKIKRFYGYLAVSKQDPGDIVFAIRGTRGAEEWLIDFSAIPVPFEPAKKKGHVAFGFQSIFTTFELVTAGSSMSLADALEQLNTGHRITSLTIIGHSLGSALATLTAAELTFLNPLQIGDKLNLWTFASPAVGLPDFAKSLDSMIKASIRVWNVLDSVPYLPPGYQHVSGNGDAIRPTEQQLQQLGINGASPRCEHILPDYLWLLDGADFPETANVCGLEGRLRK